MARRKSDETPAVEKLIQLIDEIDAKAPRHDSDFHSPITKLHFLRFGISVAEMSSNILDALQLLDGHTEASRAKLSRASNMLAEIAKSVSIATSNPSFISYNEKNGSEEEDDERS